MQLYAEQIVDLYKHPINKKPLKDATFSHSGVNITCGDHVRMYVKLKGEKIIDSTFEGNGCAISIAAACLLTDVLKEKTLDDALAMNTADMFELLEVELGPARVKCGVLCLETLQEGIKKSRAV